MAGDSDRAEYRQLRDTIYTFMYYSNKPMTNTEILLQFKSQKKSVVEKVLEDLLAKDKISMKLFGKTRIYCLSQNMGFEIDEAAYTDEIDGDQDQTIDDKCLRYLKWNYERHTNEISRLREEGKDLDIEIGAYESELTVDELEKAICGMESVVEKEGCVQEEVAISYEDFNKIKKKHGMLKREQNKLSTTFKDIADRVSEGLGVGTKEFLEQAGIEEF